MKRSHGLSYRMIRMGVEGSRTWAEGFPIQRISGPVLRGPGFSQIGWRTTRPSESRRTSSTVPPSPSAQADRRWGHNGALYSCVHDFPGDAAGIVDSVGRLVVEYRCDAGDGIMIFNGRVFGC